MFPRFIYVYALVLSIALLLHPTLSQPEEQSSDNSIPDDPTQVAYARDQAHGPAVIDELRPIDQTSNQHDTPTESHHSLNPSTDQQSDQSNVHSIKPFTKREVHAFFYAWYGAPPVDDQYYHWTHGVLPHWTPSVNENYRKDPYVAPLDPGITYYPSKGLYSSNDINRLSEQMQELYEAGVDVVAVSWWGSRLKNTSVDGQGVGSDHCMSNILDAAARHGVKVAFHLEPYADRGVHQIHDDLTYIFDQYGAHSSFYRHPTTNQGLVYLYDSYQLSSDQWKLLLTKEGSLSIRGTSIDCIAIGLVLDDINYLVDSHFDGAYSYFAATGFTQASTPSNWASLQQRLLEKGLVFIPSVAPGYDDTRLRQWNGQNKRARRHGEYYDSMWREALSVSPQIIAITSVNEWGEGSQIEPAKSFITDKGVKLVGYSEDPELNDNQDENLYLDLTRRWAEEFKGTPVPRSKHPDL